MKKFCSLLCGVLLALSLGACAQGDTKTMYLEAAQLSAEEQDIATLLGADTQQRIYDFTLDDTVNHMQINTYELVDGAWQLLSGGGGMQFTDPQGRLALGFEHIADGLRVAVQSEHNSGATAYYKEQQSDLTGMNTATSTLSERVPIVWDQEIPLTIQTVTSQDASRSFSVDSFFTPEEFAPYNYEHVYAITTLFSQAPVANE